MDADIDKHYNYVHDKYTDWELLCPYCGYNTGIDPALITEDDPMPYCDNCGEPLLTNENEEDEDV